MSATPVPGIDTASVDAALTTTRAVRRRLDLGRPVDDQVIFDCIDVAEQAPSGGNQGSRRWVIVRDPEIKAKLAELYMATGGEFMAAMRDRLDGTGHPQEKTMASAAYLAEHLAEVPAIVVPTIIGRHDASGRPGLFDSVIQSVWSFCVALRARGLGSSWTTAILAREDELAELLGVPPGNTQIAMVPVAYTIGTEFRQAPRQPARRIAFVDRYGSTWERGPSDPIRLADGPGTVVEVDIDAPANAVWEVVTDIDLPARFSDEFQGAEWVAPATGPALGATFVGRNRRDDMGEWEVTCFVDRYVEGTEFGWAVIDPDDPNSQWCFELESIAGSTRLRYSVVLGTGISGVTAAVRERPEREPDIIRSRLAGLRANMQRLLEGVRDIVTTPPARFS